MITVVDYGLGNLRSVSKAVEKLGAEVEVTDSPEKIEKADGIILPGVGAFHIGMQNLKRLNLLPVLSEAISKGTPFLGICLGFQILFTQSEEHGICNGMDIIKGKVKRFTHELKIPHMGWNQVKRQKAKGKIFNGVSDNSYFYFVHSYYAEPEDKNVIIAATEYGHEFTSAVNKDNVWGVQFHPEKSSELGLKILGNFLSLC
ncbi:imidazole glycerol phosphate synthase subunit HisH [bacterium]|nr:imidazole glycerol phosphate synthase subunit HisH [bacterium]